MIAGRFILAAAILLARPARSQQLDRPVTPQLLIAQSVADRLLLKRIEPAYPESLRLKHIAGQIVIAFTIGKDGNVTQAFAVQKDLASRESVNIDDPELCQAAVTAVKQWKYRPYMQNGDPVEVGTSVVLPFNFGQQTPADAPASLIENGSLIYIEIAKTIDAKKARPGDQVTATLLADVVSHGKVVLHHDAKLLGHVTEAQPYSKENPESRLGIVFDRVTAKDSTDVAFNSVLLALHPAPPIQVSTLSPPWHPDNHNPTPIGSTPRPSRAASAGEDSQASRIEAVRATDIDGLSLEPAPDGVNRVVVSTHQTVRLESGVRMDLRVTGGSQTKKN